MKTTAAARIFSLLLVSLASAAAQSDYLSVSSPNGQIEFRTFNIPPDLVERGEAHLAYSVSYRGKPLIQPSYLGFEIPSQIPLGQKLGASKIARGSTDETYTVPAGKSSPVRNHYNSLLIEFIQEGSQGRLMNLEVRAFDDGVAFRYFVPWSPPLAEMLIENEITQFHFAKDADGFPLILRDFESAYEDRHHKITLSGIHPEWLVGLPLLVEQPGVGWAAITEAYLDDYPGMYLRRVDGAMLRAQLAPRTDGSGLAVRVNTPMATPWRVILIGATAAEIIESNIVASLNPPSAISDTSWIRPGKALDAGANMAAIRDAIDFASEAGLEYTLIGKGWSAEGDVTRPTPGLDLPAIFNHAKQKNVGLWLWAHWTAIDSQMSEAFPLLERWGVRGIQIDGMNRDDQWMVDFYRRVAAKAAEHHLMISFRGAFKPDGLERTYPNVITRQAVMGSEHLASSAAVTPEHDVTLAFTRMLAGPMDYGPGGFNNVTRMQFRPSAVEPGVMGTRAHQLALFVVFDSPLQILSGDVAAYRGERDFEFVKAVPASWDETRALNGQAGKFVTIARRKGQEWFLGSICDWTATDFDLPLNFLGSGDYIAEVYADAEDAAENPKRTSIEQLRVNSASILKLKLATGGGAAVRIRPAR